MTKHPFENLLLNDNKIVAENYVLIQPTPHVAPAAYLHSIYKGLTELEIAEMEKQIHQKLPKELFDFYKLYNGAQLFSGALSIDGLRRNFSRNVDASRQPFSMETTNVDERIRNAPANAVFFGGYDWDGSLVYCCHGAEGVFRCDRESAEPLNRWTSLRDFFDQEIDRLSMLFSKDGKQIDEDRPTVPN